MRTFFTADTHFGHMGIISSCKRPFANADAMDEALIAQWNAVVGSGDEVWHLGDFAFRSAKAPDAYLSRLRGRKHLIWGNHDAPQVRESALWASSQQMAEIGLNGHRIIMLHYAMRSWPKSHHGSIHLYGHSHGNLPSDRQSLDVGVDCWAFRPVSLGEIKIRLAELPERGGVS